MLDIAVGILSTLSDGDALRQQIAVFLSTRESELDFDQSYGINYDMVLSRQITNKQLTSYYIDKLTTYFGTEITKIVAVEINDKDRARIVTIKYQSIYGRSVEQVATQLEV